MLLNLQSHEFLVWALGYLIVLHSFSFPRSSLLGLHFLTLIASRFESSYQFLNLDKSLGIIQVLFSLHGDWIPNPIVLLDALSFQFECSFPHQFDALLSNNDYCVYLLYFVSSSLAPFPKVLKILLTYRLRVYQCIQYFRSCLFLMASSAPSIDLILLNTASWSSATFQHSVGQFLLLLSSPISL